MGQCYGRIKSSRRGREYRRHRRFEFAPKKFWRYRDAHLLNEMTEMGEVSETDTSVAVSNVTSEEEEIDTGEVRTGGRLVFTDEEENGNSSHDPSSESHDQTEEGGGANSGQSSPSISSFDENEKFKEIDLDNPLVDMREEQEGGVVYNNYQAIT